MNVGYVDLRGSIYCTRCWQHRATSGEHPEWILDSADDGELDNFWIVDACSGCNTQVQYRSVKVLA